MKLKIPIFFIFTSLLLVACNITNPEEHSYKDKEIKELVQHYSTGDFIHETASITSTELIVEDKVNEDQKMYTLPEEEFFISIAPFVNETHPCTNHSLTGCQGELVNKDFDVYIKDMNGNVILEEQRNSGENGFVDIWLPRNNTYHVTFTLEGKKAESEISTFNDDVTCITTMQLL